MKHAFSTCVVGISISAFTVACGGSDSGNGTPANANFQNAGGMPGISGTGGALTTGNGGVLSTGSGATVSTGTGASSSVGTGAGPGNVNGKGGATVTGSGGSGPAGAGNGGAVGVSGGTGAGGATGMAGAGGDGGSVGNGGSGAGAAGGGTNDKSCCSGGDCLCHGPDPMGKPTSKNGPYKTATLTMPEGTVYYPTDAEPPLAGVSICPGFLNTGPEMAPWGPFYASWGIVCVVTNTGAADSPQIRGTKLVAAITALKKQNDSGPLMGKLAGRYGTSGYSMGGGGTTFASEADTTMKTSVGLAAWGPVGPGVKTPTLFICSDSDTVAGCSFSTTSYGQIPGMTPKMVLKIPGASHFNWFSPTDAVTMGTSGAWALAWQKVYLEGDERWKSILKSMPPGGATTQAANVN